MPRHDATEGSLFPFVKNQSCHLIIKILGDLTAPKIHGHLAGIPTHQCFHSSKGFPYTSQTLQEEDEGEFNQLMGQTEMLCL